MNKILAVISLLAISLIGCSEVESNATSNKLDTGEAAFSRYNIPLEADVKGIVKTAGNPAVKWMYLNTCYLTTVSRTYYGSFVSNTFSVPCN